MKAWFNRFIKEERGDFGVKQIAGTVAVIVVIGAIVTAITGSFLTTWIDEVWEMFTGAIEDMTA